MYENLRVFEDFLIIRIIARCYSGTPVPIKTRSGSQDPLIVDEDSIGDHIETVGPIPCGATLIGFDETRLDGNHPRELFSQGLVEDIV